MRLTVPFMLLAAACKSGDPRASSSPAARHTEASAAERVVQQQFDAYNRHDLDAFVTAHAPDVQVYRYPDSLLIEGRDALRERFGKVFASSPQLHANVDARMAHGDVVIWKETATGMPGGKPNTAISIWEVHDGLITRILFIP